MIDPPTEASHSTLRLHALSCNLAKRSAKAKHLRAASNISFARQTGEETGTVRGGLDAVDGTLQALCALNACGLYCELESIRKAVDWLVRIQNADGGWGEDGSSYNLDYRGHEPAASTASQTGWALWGLMAGGEIDHPAVSRGIRYLLETQTEDGFWGRKSRFLGR